MTDQKKINELEQELARLDKEYGDLGAYKEYGAVLKETLGLLKEQQEVSPASEKISRLEAQLNEFDLQLDEKNNKTRGLNNLEEGELYIQLGDFPEFYSIYNDPSKAKDFNGVEIEVSDGKNKVYLITSMEEYGPSELKQYVPGVCKKKLPGGNYLLKSTVGKQTVRRNITVDGDVKAYLKFENLKTEAGILELTDANIYNFIDDNQMAVVHFYAHWCDVCNDSDKVFRMVANKLKPEMRFAKANIDNCIDFQGQNNISSIPCIIQYQNGDLISSMVGLKTVDEIVDQLTFPF